MRGGAVYWRDDFVTLRLGTLYPYWLSSADRRSYQRPHRWRRSYHQSRSVHFVPLVAEKIPRTYSTPHVCARRHHYLPTHHHQRGIVVAICRYVGACRAICRPLWHLDDSRGGDARHRFPGVQLLRSHWRHTARPNARIFRTPADRTRTYPLAPTTAKENRQVIL